jgi:protein O-GlcNAc transferase
LTNFFILKALFAQALRCQEQGDFDQAARLYAQLLAQAPSDVAALNNLGGILHAQGQFDQALALHDRAIAVSPDNPDVLMNRVRTLMEMERTADALVSCDIVVAYWPDHAVAWTARGRILQRLRRIPDAIDSYDRAVALQPSDYEALNNLGIIYCELNDYARALDMLDRALAIAPDSWYAHNNRGIALRGLGRFDEAIASYARAQALNPVYAEAFYNQGDLFVGLRRYEDALLAYDRAAALAPDMPYVRGSQFYARMQLCDWTDFDASCEAMFAAVERGEPAASPFLLLLLPSTPLQQLQAARTYSAQRCADITPGLSPAYRHDRIRLAYVSATFRQHPVMQLINGVFDHHDRTRFEVFAYSLGPGDGSALRARVEGAFEHFIDAHAMDDLAVAQLIRAQEIDIAIDLDGFTEGARMGVLAQRPAPVQATWLGYPGTLGAAHIDYLIADEQVVPRGAEAGYSERIVRLPFSFQPNSARPAVDTPATRADVGLPAEGFVFCCFNNLCKITPDVFAVWMRLLAAVPGSVLWLRGDNGTAQDNILRHAERHGIAGSRILFARHADERTYYARMAAADLFLDTFHYGAHTTASDALWAGLPVVTRAGQTFAGRVGTSLLPAVGLPELVTQSATDYERRILELVCAPDELAQLRRRLAQSRTASPLFDTARFTRDLEVVIMDMVAGT